MPNRGERLFTLRFRLRYLCTKTRRIKELYGTQRRAVLWLDHGPAARCTMSLMDPLDDDRRYWLEDDDGGGFFGGGDDDDGGGDDSDDSDQQDDDQQDDDQQDGGEQDGDEQQEDGEAAADGGDDNNNGDNNDDEYNADVNESFSDPDDLVELDEDTAPPAEAFPNATEDDFQEDDGTWTESDYDESAKNLFGD